MLGPITGPWGAQAHGYGGQSLRSCTLDEFADLSPKIVEANRLVGKLVHDRHLWKDFRVTCVWNSIWIMHI
jgi:hypothetical protein